MALIKCPECGKKISDKSTACIHCGCPIENAVIENIGVAEQVPVNTEKATIKTEKKEKVKKVVDKARLKKIAIIASSAVGAIAIIAILLFFLVLKPTYEDATVIYNDAVAIYNEKVAAYEEKSSQIAAENQKLTAVIDELQSIVSSGEKPYDPNAISVANTAINEGKIALIEIPKWEDKGLKAAEDYNIFQAGTMKKDSESVKTYTTELTGIIESMQIPDHTEVIEVVNKGKAALEFSIKQMKQVTCPSESFVLERITNIRDQAGMTDVIALTEDNDPENYIGKAGWYTAKIIFRHKDVEHYGLESGLLTLSEVGNPAGGCVEVYRTEEDAQRRADELKSQEGTARSPGARVICGTMVIRVSDDLKTSYQQELLTLITNEMLRIEQTEQSSQGNTTKEENPSQGEQTTPNTTTSTDNNSNSDNTSSSNDNSNKTETPKPNKNQEAVAAAEEMVNFYATVYPTLVKQLLMEDYSFSESQANYGVNNANIDWNFYAKIHLEEYYGINEGNVTKSDAERHLGADKGYSDSAIQYAFANADIDWDKAANPTTQPTNPPSNRDEDAIEEARWMAYYDYTATPADIQLRLVSELGFSSEDAWYCVGKVTNALLDGSHYNWIERVEYYVTYELQDYYIQYTWCNNCEEVYGVHEKCPICGSFIPSGYWSTFGYTKEEVISKLKKQGFSDSDIQAGLNNIPSDKFYDESKYKKP